MVEHKEKKNGDNSRLEVVVLEVLNTIDEVIEKTKKLLSQEPPK